MLELGNIIAGQTLDFCFNTHKADGTPITLAGSPVITVYRGYSGANTTTGVLYELDDGSTTGKHSVHITTSDAFYASGSDYSVVLTAGTVDGTSVAGTVLAHFSIMNRAADVRMLNGVKTDGTPAVGSRPVLYLDRLDLHNNNGVYGALQVTNDAGNGINVSAVGAIGIYVFSGSDGISVFGTCDIRLAGSGTIMDGSGYIIVSSTSVAGVTPAEAGDEMDLIDAPNSTAIAAIAGAVQSALFDPATVKIKLTAEGYVYAAREDGTPIYYTLSGDVYCSRSDVEDIFGVSNVAKWALLSASDPAGVEGLAEISARIARAISWATADINNHLRDGGYSVPVTSAGAAATMTILAATMAGVWLYENRGATEFHPETGQPEHRYQWKKRESEKLLDSIRAGKIRLDAERLGGASTGPLVQQTPRPPRYGSHDAGINY